MSMASKRSGWAMMRPCITSLISIPEYEIFHALTFFTPLMRCAIREKTATDEMNSTRL
jgi:hypothetical protein